MFITKAKQHEIIFSQNLPNFMKIESPKTKLDFSFGGVES